MVTLEKKQKEEVSTDAANIVRGYTGYVRKLQEKGDTNLPAKPTSASTHGSAWILEFANGEEVDAANVTRFEVEEVGMVKCERSNRTRTRFYKITGGARSPRK